MEAPAHRRDGGEVPKRSVRVALIVVMVCAAAVCMRSVLLTANGVRWGDTEPRADELLGAADYNTISGKATIFWGEEDGMPGRYPPAYAAQLKKMRRLVQQVKLNNERYSAPCCVGASAAAAGSVYCYICWFCMQFVSCPKRERLLLPALVFFCSRRRRRASVLLSRFGVRGRLAK